MVSVRERSKAEKPTKGVQGGSCDLTEWWRRPPWNEDLSKGGSELWDLLGETIASSAKKRPEGGNVGNMVREHQEAWVAMCMEQGGKGAGKDSGKEQGQIQGGGQQL